MIKWIDEIEKQIAEIQAEVDGIEAGDVDAKNLSEVLDKDAPIKLTTDLENNKVKIGVNIDKTAPVTTTLENNKLTLGLDYDTDTLEIDNGKLKVKSSGGTKKYLHQGRCNISFVANSNQHTFYGVSFSFVNTTSNACTDSDIRTQYSGQQIVLTGGVGYVTGNDYGVLGSMILKDLGYNYGSQGTALNISNLAIETNLSGMITIEFVNDSVTEL